MQESSGEESGFEGESECDSARKQSSEEELSTARPCGTPHVEAREQLPSIPLSGFTHSLVPDMAFGWRPKLVHGGPIPLLFNKCELPVCVDPCTQEEFAVMFNGFRPRDSMVMHQTLSGKDTYPMPVLPAMDVYEFLHRRDHRLKDARPFTGMNPSLSSTPLVFDSTFECGNLDKVVQISKNEYDLYMRVDANTRGFHQWYYFSVRNEEVGDVTFNIVNFTKNESLYSQGMLPVVLSEKNSAKGWHRSGTNIKYRPSKLNQLLTDRRTYFALTFTYRFEYAQDKVYFAYAFPYTFSRLCKVIAELTAANPAIIRRETLCKSLSGVDVPLITITNFQQTEKKEHVVITARVHPGETHGSWMVEVLSTQGLMRYLASDSPVTQALRERLVFSIVPCLNPDGVIMGNYRTGFSGHDLNRQFVRPDPMLHPTVAAVKKMMRNVMKEEKIAAFLDLHAHSKKKSVFIYGPRYPLHSKKYYTMRLLARLICEQGAEYRYAACRFRNEASKQQAARLVIWKEMKLANSYTVEGSFYGYLDEERKTKPFTQETVLDAGVCIAKGLYEYLALLDSEARQKEERRRARKLKHSKTHDSEPQQTVLVPSETMETVLRRIKEEEEKHNEQPEPGDNSESSSEENIAEDQLTLEDQARLHEEIVSIMEEFSSLSRPRLRRPATKTIKTRPKALERTAPEVSCSFQCCEDKSIPRTSHSKRKPRPLLHADAKVNSTFLTLPKMAECRATRSMSTCKKKRSEPIQVSKPRLSKCTPETRRILARMKPGDSFEERIMRFLKGKSPAGDRRSSFCFEDEETEFVGARPLLITSKSPLACTPLARCLPRPASVVANSSFQKPRLKRHPAKEAVL